MEGLGPAVTGFQRLPKVGPISSHPIPPILRDFIPDFIGTGGSGGGTRQVRHQRQVARSQEGGECCPFILVRMASVLREPLPFRRLHPPLLPQDVEDVGIGGLPGLADHLAL